MERATINELYYKPFIGGVMTVFMSSYMTKISLVVLLIILSFGCSNRTKPVTSGIGVNEIAQVNGFNQHLVVDNKMLAKKLFISDVKSRKSNEILEVNVTLKSTFKKSQKLQYHFTWFDRQGFVIEARKTAWKPLEVHGEQAVTLRGVAPNIKVESFKMYIREVPEKAYKY